MQVSGLGLLESYVQMCPGQDVPQQQDMSGITTVYAGTTYCMMHIIPLLPSGVTLTGHTLSFNGEPVLTVAGAPRAALKALTAC